MKKIVLLIVLNLFISVAYTATPTCHQHSAGAYCKYDGKVRNIYVNSSNIILLYFEKSIDISVPQRYGMNVTNGNATAFNLNENPNFAKLFYSTALAAQASGRKISIQMRGDIAGYLKFNRIWLGE